MEPKIDSELSDLGDDFKPDLESKSEETVSSMMKVLNKWRGTEKSETQRKSKGKWTNHFMSLPKGFLTS